MSSGSAPLKRPLGPVGELFAEEPAHERGLQWASSAVSPAHARAYARETEATGGGEHLADEVTASHQTEDPNSERSIVDLVAPTLRRLALESE